MQSTRLRLTFVLLFAAVVLAGLWQPAPLDDLRNLAFDVFQRIDPPEHDASSPVRIVAIDEASLAEIGQWPWPRSRMAEIVDRLRAAGAAAITFDLFFAEPDRTSLDTVLRAMPDSRLRSDLIDRLASEPSNDALLAKALDGAPVVLAAVMQTSGKAHSWIQKAGFVVAGDDPAPLLPSFASALLPLPGLMGAAGGIGATNWLPDRDGVVRRVPLLVRSGDALMPSLAMEALRLAQGASTYILRGANASGTTSFGRNTGLSAVKVGEVEVATSQDGSIRPRYTRSAADRFLSAKDLLAGHVDPDEIRGRVIFVGTTATGLGDVRATPLESVAPGVEIHAQVLEQLLLGRLLSRPDWALGAECLSTLASLAVLAVVLTRVPPLVGALLSSLLCLFFIAGAWFAFDHYALLLDATFPIAAITLAYVATASMLWQTEQRARRQVRSAFGKYVAPAVVARIAENPKLLVLSGETRDLTILFSDLRSFSTISEGLQAHEVARFLNAYLTPMTDAILDHDGTIDKYIGDAIVAFWNAPLDVPDHPRRAVDAALAMRTALQRFNIARAEHAGPEMAESLLAVRMGIGLNFGACSVGNMGSNQRFDYSVLGDPVNVAARLEALTKAYGVDLLATSSVVERSQDYAWFEIDEVRVKGRSSATMLFGLAGDQDTARSTGFAEWQAKHRRMLEQNRAGRPGEAVAMARELGRALPSWSLLYEALAARYGEAIGKPAEVESLAHHDTP